MNILPQLGLPVLRLPWTSFPSSSTHQQYPDVMWHCTALYSPSSLHSGPCKPTTGTPLSPRAWRLWIWQGLSHATKENNHTIEKKRTIIYTVKPRFKDTRLIRTPQYHGQFACLWEKKVLTFSLNTTRLIRTLCLTPSESVLTGFDCTSYLHKKNKCKRKPSRSKVGNFLLTGLC